MGKVVSCFQSDRAATKHDTKESLLLRYQTDLKWHEVDGRKALIELRKLGVQTWLTWDELEDFAGNIGLSL
jgi:hypothetical protein